jgi:putative aldouronate transport system permease protein
MNTQKTLTRTQKRNIFFGSMVTVPILIFIIFYGVINANTIIMAFKNYAPAEDSDFGYKVTFAGFENFKIVIEMLCYKDNWMMLRNSFVLWFFKLVIGLPVSIIFSYYVYKKAVGSRFFRVILFLPNIISNLIMVYLFRYFANNAIVSLFNLKLGLIDNPNTTFATILFFNLWLGFAGQTLLITSAMSSINGSIEEATQVDGVNTISELFYITLPMILPTLTTFIVLSIAELFVDQMSLVTFYDQFSVLPHIKTVGYYLFQQAYVSEVIPNTSWVDNHTHGKLSYAQLSAFGVMISAFVIPVSFGVRKLLNHIDPNN